MTMTRVVAALLLFGCGSNQSEVPPELVDAIKNSERSGETGTQVGDTVENLCFEGWQNPRASLFDPSAFEQICLYDFAESSGATLLLVNAAAIWCITCRVEYEGSTDRPSMSENLQRRYDQGFRILGTLFQDAAGNPPSDEDGVVWTQTFDVDFPFVLDRDFKLGDFSVAAQAPFNMLIDLSSKKILLKVQGDEPAVIYGAVDEFLAGGRAQ